MNKLKKIVAKAMNKRASEWKLGKLIAEDIEQEKKLHGSIPITNYAVYWNIQVFNDMKELDVPQLSKKAQDAIFDDIEVALQGGFSKGEIQLQKEDLEEEDIKILNEDLLLEFFLNFEEKDLDLDNVEIDLGNTYEELPESYVKFRQLASKKKQVSKMASIISKEMLKSANISKKASNEEEKQALAKFLDVDINELEKTEDYYNLPTYTTKTGKIYSLSSDREKLKKEVANSLERSFDEKGYSEFQDFVVGTLGNIKKYLKNGKLDFERMAIDQSRKYGYGLELSLEDSIGKTFNYNGKIYFIFRQQ